MIDRYALDVLAQIGLEGLGLYVYLVAQGPITPPAVEHDLSALGLSGTALATHLAILEHAGLITTTEFPGTPDLPEAFLPRQHTEKHPPGYVYIVGGSGYYKIGLSATPHKRFAGLQTSVPFPLTMIHLIATPSMGSTEALLHTRFEQKRTTGEWFLLDQADLDWIREQFPATTEEAR